MSQATTDLNTLITDSWGVPLEELIEAHLARASIFQKQQRTIKAKADFAEVCMLASVLVILVFDKNLDTELQLLRWLVDDCALCFCFFAVLLGGLQGDETS